MAEENLELTSGVDDAGDAPTQEEITEARSLGWKPLQEWKGDQTKHLDVKPYLERARGILPIVTAGNERLRGELTATAQQLRALEQRNREQAAALAALQETAQEDQQADYEQTKRELKAKIADASRNGDHEALADATEQLAELRPPEKSAATDAAAGGGRPGDMTPQAQTVLVNEVLPWFEANPAYKVGPEAGLANHFSAQLRASGRTWASATAFLDEVKGKVEEYLGKQQVPGVTRVGSGNGGTGRSAAPAGSEKSYSDLPPDAKQFCESFARRVVGEGKKHKTIESWRKSYTKQYFAQEGAQQ